MEFEFFSANLVNVTCKCSIHLNGRLGFTLDAANMLELNTEKYLKIGKATDFNESGNLIILVVDRKDSDAFSISTSGGYYYASTKKLFEMLKYDFKSQKYVYDIFQEDYPNMKVFLLKRREITIREKNEIEDNEI